VLVVACRAHQVFINHTLTTTVSLRDELYRAYITADIRRLDMPIVNVRQRARSLGQHALLLSRSESAAQADILVMRLEGLLAATGVVELTRSRW